MDYNALENMTVASLREEAKKFEDIKAAAMKKEELVVALAEKYGLEKPAVKPKKKKAKGAAPTKDQIKGKLVELKALRDKAKASNDRKQASVLRRRIHGLKRRLGKAA